MIHVNKENLNNWIASIYICETIVCSMIACFISIENISVFLMITLIILCLVVNRKLSVRRLKKSVIAFTFVETTLFISGLLNSFKIVGIYILYFSCFGITAMIISITQLQIMEMIKKITKIYFCYYILYFLVIRKDFLNSGNNYYGQSMGIAYAVVVSVYVFIAMIIYRKDILYEKSYRNLALINCLAALFIILIDCRSRGPIVAIILCIVLFLISKVANWKKVILFILFICFTMVMIYNMNFIFSFMSNWLNQRGIYINAIDKFRFLSTSGIGILNGRDSYYEVAFGIIMKYPIMGRGIGYFESMANGEYVHNIILELMTDFGIIGAGIILVIILFKPIKCIWEKNNATKKFSVLLIFCIGELMLFFSSSFWLAPSFWFLFFYYIQDEKYYKSQKAAYRYAVFQRQL